MISLTNSLEHMAWSNQKVFQQIGQLPESIYGLRAAESEWPLGKIMTHFLGAGEWYRFLLTDAKWTDLEKIQSHEILARSAKYLADLDLVMIEESLKPDGEITFKGDDGNQHKTTRGLVLAQAVMHTAEHKGQLATILKMHGHHLDLDALDHWSFASNQ
jgi:uncharacterized damage-inducible protein DinB